MKTLLLLTLLASCATPQRMHLTKPVKVTPMETKAVRLQKCIDFFMTKHGTKVSDAIKVCEAIHGRM